MPDLKDAATALAAVSDPATPPADLATIARYHPSLRRLVAQHPNAYPGLLDWLKNLGDPQLAQTVAARRASARPQAEAQPQSSGKKSSGQPKRRVSAWLVALIVLVVVAVVAGIAYLATRAPAPAPTNHGPVVTPSATPTQAWSKVLAGDQFTGVQAMAVAPDGDLVVVTTMADDGVFTRVAGSTVTPTGDDCSADAGGGSCLVGVATLSPQGDVKWAIDYASDGMTVIMGLAVAPDGTIALAGSTAAVRSDLATNTGTGANGAILAELSSDGALKHGVIYSAVDPTGMQTTSLDGVAFLPDGTVVAVGANNADDGDTIAASDDTGLDLPVAVALAPDGSLAWTTALGVGSDQAIAVATGSDGLAHIAVLSQDADGQVALRIGVFGAAGVVDAPVTVNLNVTTSAQFALTALSDGSFALLYGDDQGVVVTKLAADGTPAWTTQTPGGWVALASGPDGVYLVGGGGPAAGHEPVLPTTPEDGCDDTHIEDAAITLIAPDGTQGWTRILGGTGTDEFDAVAVGPDGALYAGGFTDSHDGDFPPAQVDDNPCQIEQGNALIVRLNPDGTPAPR
jgi:hypothetical protein